MQLHYTTMHFEESAGALAQVWPQTASAERRGHRATEPRDYHIRAFGRLFKMVYGIQIRSWRAKWTKSVCVPDRETALTASEACIRRGPAQTRGEDNEFQNDLGS
jgi:hypothetical protein